MRDAIIDLIEEERERQDKIGNSSFDKTNTQADWVSCITAYAGRANESIIRNKNEGQTFKQNMIKVAALALAALESHEKGHC